MSEEQLFSVYLETGRLTNAATLTMTLGTLAAGATATRTWKVTHFTHMTLSRNQNLSILFYLFYCNTFLVLSLAYWRSFRSK